MEAAQPETARGATERRVERATLVVLATICALGLACVAASPLWPVRPSLAREIPWWVFAIAFACTERIVLNIQVRREAQTISLSELPLVVGLFLATPGSLLLGRLLGSAIVFVVHRRSPPLKSCFNLALIAAETTVAVATFHAIVGSPHRVGVMSWLAAYAGATLATVVGSLLLGRIIAVYEGGFELLEILRSAAWGLPVTVAVATFGLLGATSIGLAPVSAWLVAMCALFLLVGYRSYSTLADRHLSLERLFRFSQMMSSAPELDHVLSGVLAEARNLLHAERAEIVFVSSASEATAVRVYLASGDQLRRSEYVQRPHDKWLREEVVDTNRSMVLSRHSHDQDTQTWLDECKLREAVAAPLAGSRGSIGMLIVGDRLGDVRTFDDSDMRLLQTVAVQAGLALQNETLTEKLRYESTHDVLTGLPNRARFEQDLGVMLDRMNDGKGPGAAVMLLSLDRFTEVNDTLGRRAADDLLIVIANRLRTVVESEDCVARLGDEEFALLLSATATAAAARSVATRIAAVIEQPFLVGSLEIVIGCLIGAAIAPIHGSEKGLLLKRADSALSQAKTSGRGFHAYEEALDTNRPRRLALTGHLRRAVINGDVVPFFQPKATLSTGSVHSVEALARWTHPELGSIPPDEFIPVAERSGLIDMLTASMLDQSLAACARWQRLGVDLSVAVNVSPRNLLDSDLLSTVAELLGKHRIRPGLLTIEITENALMSDPAASVEVLHHLRTIGVRLSVDDFGTGYSSLAYLKLLPIHEIKIDRSFITDMESNAGDQAIVQSVVALARHLRLDVVAEGCETEGAERLLRDMGCDLVQGWHVARPMAEAEIGPWLGQRTIGIAAAPAHQRANADAPTPVAAR